MNDFSGLQNPSLDPSKLGLTGGSPNFFNGGSAFAPHYEVIRVNGEAGARNFRMGPNSSALLLDNTASIVWFAQTDGAGYCVLTPYDLFPHKQEKTITLDELYQRVQQLEETVNGRQSDSKPNKQRSKKQSSSRSDQDDVQTNDE